MFNNVIPLPTALADGRAYVETPNGDRCDLYPLYATGNQSALVLPSETPAGEGKIVVEHNSQTSNPFRVMIVDRQPGFFTLN